MNGLNGALSKWAPHMLSILRIVAGLLFLQHGLMKLVGFPIEPRNYPGLFSLYWWAGAIEIVGGILLIIGLFTRPAAFIMSGEMAFAYFMSHAPRSLYPIDNNGEAAILFCFVFLYIVFAGPGLWSLDEKRAQTA